jgi:hypothetical protein
MITAASVFVHFIREEKGTIGHERQLVEVSAGRARELDLGRDLEQENGYLSICRMETGLQTAGGRVCYPLIFKKGVSFLKAPGDAPAR